MYSKSMNGCMLSWLWITNGTAVMKSTTCPASSVAGPPTAAE
jgi:hypothetical protein